jgi:hypothetical protein
MIVRMVKAYRKVASTKECVSTKKGGVSPRLSLLSSLLSRFSHLFCLLLFMKQKHCKFLKTEPLPTPHTCTYTGNASVQVTVFKHLGLNAHCGVSVSAA